MRTRDKLQFLGGLARFRARGSRLVGSAWAVLGVFLLLLGVALAGIVMINRRVDDARRVQLGLVQVDGAMQGERRIELAVLGRNRVTSDDAAALAGIRTNVTT